MSKVIKSPTKRHRNLDRIDRAILSALQADGRMSNVALAEKVHLSPSPCLERVKRLEAAGYITGYSAQLDADMLGYGKVAFIQVTLERTTEEVFLEFKNEVKKSDFVAECHMVAGGYDYLLKVRFEDMENYRSVLERIVRFPGVSQTHTYMVIEQVKIVTDVPLD
ncbi:winged helix-turn-helix transcriptional regulator [Arenicella xantha]|uniref:Leucine-responsive regulatory protein n=1 Tax=Arenicella xantha TaxID=644221 RepID=A0A395JS53_9GAMM|nr:winged helix-turn-helix transcriptional regulator [Arenicella xantha]RBP53276.1 Lrp/AsnC family leucine-responsive transcriptional regulator [Arenicella xantha]